jgi:hypothetical protein
MSIGKSSLFLVAPTLRQNGQAGNSGRATAKDPNAAIVFVGHCRIILAMAILVRAMIL